MKCFNIIDLCLQLQPSSIDAAVTQHSLLNAVSPLKFGIYRIESLFLSVSLPCSMSPFTADNAILPNTQLFSHLRRPTLLKND